MRVGFTGKGGSGKTTLAATTARVLARRGYRVHALDGDPNPNLGAAVGLDETAAARLRRVPREAILTERSDADGHSRVRLTKPIDEVLAEFGAIGPDNVGVLTMTGLLGAGKGCICGQHSTVREVMDQLAAPGGDVTILDTEASIEHLSRGTVRNVDALVVVTEPYYRSLETAGRVVPLARELGIAHVWVVANKIRDERDKEAILQYGAGHGFEMLGAVPFDPEVVEADLTGRALIDHAPDAAAVQAVERLADALVERLGSTRPGSARPAAPVEARG